MTSAASSADNRNMGTRIFWLAVAVVSAFLVFYGAALANGIFSSPDDYSGVEKVTSTLGPIVATVIGFYFGQRPVQSLTEQVQEVAVKKEKAKVGLEETSDQTSEQRAIANEQIQDLREQLRTKDEIITRLSRALEQQ
jgi:uncharacterized membrane protein YgaE (UPF0421/DUF939 family)